jgi:hypothetical protein
VELSDGKDLRCLDMLAGIYARVGRSTQAVKTEQLAIDLAFRQHDDQLE